MLQEYEVVVVGAGCAGLWTAHALCRLGVKVLLVDAAARVAEGPSSRNAGHVHGGAVHSVLARDDDQAIEIVRVCQEGLARIRSFCPAAVVPGAGPLFALARRATAADRADRRWRAAGVSRRLLSTREVATRLPELDPARVALAAEVEDVPIDVRILYRALLAEIGVFGGEVRLRSRARGFDGETCFVEGPGGCELVPAQAVVYCTGVASGLPPVARTGAPAVGLWKSHVLVTPRLTDYGFIFVDPGEVSMVPHWGCALVCRGQDDTPVATVNYEPDPDRVGGILRKLNEVMPGAAARASSTSAHACLKPSLGDASREVGIHVVGLSPREILALPGKATAAPVMAATVVHMLFAGHTNAAVADRPGDTSRPAAALRTDDTCPDRREAGRI